METQHSVGRGSDKDRDRKSPTVDSCWDHGSAGIFGH
jgi:hypothetical protein